MLVHCITPTNNPTAIKKDLLPSLKYFNKLNSFVSLGFIFQKPYTEEDISFVLTECKKQNITTYHDFKTYNMTRMNLNTMREDAAQLNPTADYYFYMDDDMSFNENIISAMLIALRELKLNQNFMSVYFIKDKPWEHHEHKDKIELCVGKEVHFGIAGNGFLIKNCYDNGHILPEKLLSLKGAPNDVFVNFQRFLDFKKYLALGIYMNVGDHFENKSGKEEIGKNKYKWFYNGVDEDLNVTYLNKHHWKDWQHGDLGHPHKGFYKYINMEDVPTVEEIKKLYHIQ